VLTVAISVNPSGFELSCKSGMFVLCTTFPANGSEGRSTDCLNNFLAFAFRDFPPDLRFLENFRLLPFHSLKFRRSLK